MHTSASSYAQFGVLGQHQQPLFIKLDHAPNLQQLQQNLHRTSCSLFYNHSDNMTTRSRSGSRPIKTSGAANLLPLGVTGVVIRAAQKLQDLERLNIVHGASIFESWWVKKHGPRDGCDGNKY